MPEANAETMPNRSGSSSLEVAPLPHPARYRARRGATGLGRGLRLRPNGAPSRSLARVLERAQARVDAQLARRPRDDAPVMTVALTGAGAETPSRFAGVDDDERYVLEVTAGGGSLTSAHPRGVLHGLERMLQLITTGPDGPFLPALTLEDGPRFAWRGLLLDLSRHWLPLGALERTLEGMAACGLDVLHLHLSDDQSFRFGSRRFPNLPGAGSDGRWLTVDDCRRLVDAADALGIRVVPELDMPGHAGSWLLGHPELSAGPVPRTLPRAFGVGPWALDPTSERVYTLLAELLEELAGVFPDRYLHIGGDEVEPRAWRTPAIETYMREHGIEDHAALQARFSTRVSGIVEALGRRAVVWDDALHRDLPESVAVQIWRSAGRAERALAAGHDVVLSAGWYLDLGYPAAVHHALDPGLPLGALAAAERRALEHPALREVRDGALRLIDAADAAPAPPAAPTRGRLLGGEACQWGELVDASILDRRVFSRLPAVAERLWSPSAKEVDEGLEARLERFLQHLEASTSVRPCSGVEVQLARLGVTRDERPHVRTLMEALEPVKWYRRLLGDSGSRVRSAGGREPERRPYDADSPLDRLVDLLEPESRAAKTLSRLLARLTARGDDALGELALRDLAHRWRFQRHALAGLTTRVAAFREIRAQSEALAELAELLDELAGALAAEEAAAPVIARYAELRARASAAVGETELAVLRPFEALQAGAEGWRA